MSYRLPLFVLILAALLVAACQPAAPAPTPTPSAVPSPTLPPVARLRVEHNGGAAVEKLVIIFPEDRIEFTDLEPGEITEYVEVPNGVYSYAAYEVVIDGKQYDQPVIDWMGEAPVQGQDFTWLLDIEPNRGQFNVVALVKATIDR